MWRLVVQNTRPRPGVEGRFERKAPPGARIQIRPGPLVHETRPMVQFVVEDGEVIGLRYARREFEKTGV